MTGPSKPVRAADLLLGVDLGGGWTVVAKPAIPADATGGEFSVGYHVERKLGDGQAQKGFLKALDLRAALEISLATGMPMVDALQEAIARFTFERDLVMRCARSRLPNVVVGLDAGEVIVDHPRLDPLLARVPYIIFERAVGDVRRVIAEKLARFDEAWLFRTLHGVAKAIQQLHGDGVTHQDIKPSNVMSFDVATTKVGDLGRASTEDLGGMFDHEVVAGDRTYAPPELLYGWVLQDDRCRRRATDMYHLGSLLVYLFTGAGLTTLLSAELDETFHWRTWPRDYPNVLPYVRDAFNTVLERLERDVPEYLRRDVVQLVRTLCDPDPSLRGDALRGDGVGRYAMERFITRLDLLARRAELELRRAS